MHRFIAFCLSVLLLVPLLAASVSATPAATVILQIGAETQVLSAGECLPFPEVPEGKAFVGWGGEDTLLPAGVTYAPTADATLTALFVGMQSHAEVRLGDAKGIRILTDIDRSDLQALLAYTTPAYGTLIVPEAYLQAADGVLTPTALAAAGKAKYIEARADGFYVETDTVCTLSGSVVALRTENLDLAFVGAGYLKVTYTNGEIAYVTATPSAAVTPYAQALVAHADRVASADATHVNAVEGGYSPYTAAELAYFAQILSGRIDLSYWMTSANHPLTLTPADSYHQLPYTAVYDLESESVVLTVNAGSSFRFDQHLYCLVLDGYLTSDVWNKLNLTVSSDGRQLAVKYREYTDLE